MTDKAQALCNELFREVEGSMSDAWISDDAGTSDPAEYLRFVRGHLAALEEARGTIRKFLKRHSHRRISTKEVRKRAGRPVSLLDAIAGPPRQFDTQ